MWLSRLMCFAFDVVAFMTRHVFHGKRKDVLPMTCRSYVYSYKCCCEQQYRGIATQVFTERIKQHVPLKLNAKAPVIGLCK